MRPTHSDTRRLTRGTSPAAGPSCATRWLVVLALCAATGIGRAADEVAWHTRVEDARAAAAKSGKAVYLYIFTPAQNACKRMRSETLTSPLVAPLLGRFECCAIDASLAANAALVDKYAWGVSTDAENKVRFGSMPANLFTDAAGEEHYIRWGFIPARAFVTILEQVAGLARLKATLAKDPTDARAHAGLGHLMVELELFVKGKEHLAQALKNDPGNKLGAFADATLDLIILAIPDDPAKGYTALTRFVADYPKSGRGLEARYFQAVALSAQGTPAAYGQALKLLEPFRTGDKTRPEFSSPWTLPALELQRQLRAELAKR